MCCAYIQLLEDRVLFYPREHDSHRVGAILQERNLHSVHVVGEFLDVRLQLCKGWKTAGERVSFISSNNVLNSRLLSRSLNVDLAIFYTGGGAN